jgi:hypothetical protein
VLCAALTHDNKASRSTSPVITLHNMKLNIALCAGALVACLLSSYAGPAFATFSVDEIRRGITEAQFKSAMEKEGFRVANTERSNLWWVYNPANNDLIATYRTCRGRIYEQALAATGGHGAFIKRVAQFTRDYGAAEYSAESAVVEQGERNMLDFTWKRTDEIITVTFNAASQRVSETQWVSRAVPSVCSQ